jgi:hypothetical protein
MWSEDRRTERLPGIVLHNARLVTGRDTPVGLLGTKADRSRCKVLVISAAAKRAWVFWRLGRKEQRGPGRESFDALLD